MYRMQWLAPDWQVLRDYFIAAGRHEAGAFLLVRWGQAAIARADCWLNAS